MEKASRQSAESNTRAALLAELRRVNLLMEQNETFFNMTSDPNLTEYAIHERSALMARHRYLLQEIRRLDGHPEQCRRTYSEAIPI